MFGKNLKIIRKQRCLTLEKLAELYNSSFPGSGMSKGTLSKYESGKQEPMISTVGKLAKILNISTDVLMGNELYHSDPVPGESMPYNPKVHKIPILGKISAGLPLYAEEHIEDYTYTELNGGAEYFALRVKGDSMNAAKINDGDILIIRRQEKVENGEIAVVMVNKENATVKRFKKDKNIVQLIPQSFNPEHNIQIYDLKSDEIRILGKVVECKIKFS